MLRIRAERLMVELNKQITSVYYFKKLWYALENSWTALSSCNLTAKWWHEPLTTTKQSPIWTGEPRVLQITGMCRASSEILTGGRRERAPAVRLRVPCRLQWAPPGSLSPRLSCRTAVLPQRLFHSASKSSATHVLSAQRRGTESISARWQAGVALARHHPTHARCHLQWHRHLISTSDTEWMNRP